MSNSPDAVIVLANHMDTKGVLNKESSARVKKAVEVFNATKSKNLVTCGWAYRPDCDIAIADAFKSTLISKFKINPQSIITEINSRDTVGDAFFTKINHAIPRSWRHLCIVTSDYHVKRTEKIFKFIYGPSYCIEVYGAQVGFQIKAIIDEQKSLEAFYETFKGVMSGCDSLILERMRIFHPFYNGLIYKKIQFDLKI